MHELFECTRPLRHLPWYVRYGATALLVGLAFALRSSFPETLRDFPFLLFFPALILSSVLFNRGSGQLATVLSAGLAAYFFLEPIGSFAIENSGQFVGWCLFVIIGIAITIIVEAQHAAYRELDDAHRLLKDAHDAALLSEADKANLLREMSHRVMNNLHTVMSLLQLQARGSDVPTREDFLAAAERVGVMARVQQRLVRSEGAVYADSREFIEELCTDLRTALIGVRPIDLHARAESHPVPLNDAVSVGLIINELVVNALKYAFPGDRSGHVLVEFAREADQYRLAVSDNGIGMSHPDQPSGPTSKSVGLGQRLVNSFVTSLGGQYDVRGMSTGTVCTVRFPVWR